MARLSFTMILFHGMRNEYRNMMTNENVIYEGEWKNNKNEWGKINRF